MTYSYFPIPSPLDSAAAGVGTSPRRRRRRVPPPAHAAGLPCARSRGAAASRTAAWVPWPTPAPPRRRSDLTGGETPRAAALAMAPLGRAMCAPLGHAAPRPGRGSVSRRRRPACAAPPRAACLRAWAKQGRGKGAIGSWAPTDVWGPAVSAPTPFLCFPVFLLFRLVFPLMLIKS